MNQQALFSTDLAPVAAPITLLERHTLSGFKEEFTPPKGNPSEMPLEEKIEIAVEAISALFRLKKSVSLACSFGKDSSILLMLALVALERTLQQGYTFPTLFVQNADTGLENPVVADHVNSEIRKLLDYAEAKKLPIKVKQSRPTYNNNYLANIIGGRITLSVAGMTRTCQAMMKQQPMEEAKRELLKEQAAELGLNVRQIPLDQTCTLIGTRFDESDLRAKAMHLRQESATAPTLITKNGASNWVLSPIADFTEEDIFWLIAKVTNNQIDTYSDFQSLTEIYRESQGDCMVNIYLSGNKETAAACGQRTGCWICCARDEDKSLMNMINNESGKFEWIRNLNTIRDYMLAQHFNPTKRGWTARSTNDGMMVIGANTYSPEYTAEILRYILTADADEAVGRENPRFQNLTLDEVIYIDTLWSRYGYHKGHKALSIWNEVHNEGKRFYPPADFKKYERNQFPKGITIPFTDRNFDGALAGFRCSDSALVCPELNTITKNTSKQANLDPRLQDILNCISPKAVEQFKAMKVKSHSDGNGSVYFDASTSSSFEVDAEGLERFAQLEMKRVISQSTGSEISLLTYLRYGFVSLSKGAHSSYDRMMRIGSQLERYGITTSDYSNPVTLIHKIANGQSLTEEQRDNINTQLADPKFVRYHQDHFFKPVTLLDGSSATAYTPRNKEEQLSLPIH